MFPRRQRSVTEMEGLREVINQGPSGGAGVGGGDACMDPQPHRDTSAVLTGPSLVPVWSQQPSSALWEGVDRHR